MIRLVNFKEAYAPENDPQFGILLEDNSIICLCCGSVIDDDEHLILQYCDWVDMSSLLKNKNTSSGFMQRSGCGLCEEK